MYIVTEKKRESSHEANPVGENTSFIFTDCVKSVPLYHFKPSFFWGGGADLLPPRQFYFATVQKRLALKLCDFYC